MSADGARPLDPAQRALCAFVAASRARLLDEIADCRRAHEDAERSVQMEAERLYPGQPWRHYAPPEVERQFEAWAAFERVTGLPDG